MSRLSCKSVGSWSRGFGSIACALVLLQLSACRYGNNMPRPEATTSKPINLQSVSSEAPAQVAYEEPAPVPAGYQHILDQTKSISGTPSAAKHSITSNKLSTTSDRKPKKVVKPKNTSPFGSARMPIPDNHLVELEEAFGDQPAKKPTTSLSPIAPIDSARGRLQPTIPAATIAPTRSGKKSVDSLAQRSTPGSTPLNATPPAVAPTMKEEVLKKEPNSIPAGTWSARSSKIPATTASSAPSGRNSAPTTVSPKRSTDKPAVTEQPVLPNLVTSDGSSATPVPELLSPAEKFISKFTAPNRALIYQGIAVLALLAVFFIVLWLRLERQHSKPQKR